MAVSIRERQLHGLSFHHTRSGFFTQQKTLGWSFYRLLCHATLSLVPTYSPKPLGFLQGSDRGLGASAPEVSALLPARRCTRNLLHARSVDKLQLKTRHIVKRDLFKRKKFKTFWVLFQMCRLESLSSLRTLLFCHWFSTCLRQVESLGFAVSCLEFIYFISN